MKNTIKILGIITIMAITGFTMTGCIFITGTYTRNGNNANITYDGERATATVSGSTLRINYEDSSFTATKTNTSNQFAGIWKGTAYGDDVEIAFGNTIWVINIDGET